jgi:PAS domain S-box-containing protein
MPDQLTQPMEKVLKAAAAVAASGAAVIGAFYFVSWMTGSMAYLGFETVTMKTNAALCAVMTGISALLAIPERSAKSSRSVAGLLAAVALAIAILTLFEHIMDWNLGIDQLLAEEPYGALGVVYPNRMGPPAAASFSLLGTAVLLLLRGKGPNLVVAQWLGLISCLVAFMALLAHFYGVEGMYGAARHTSIAWQTASAILLLGIALLFLTPRHGVMAVITANDPGGLALRRLLLPAIVVPVFLGRIVLEGEWYALYEHYFGTTILVLSFILVFTLLIYLTGKQLSVLSAGQRRAVEERQRTQTLLLEAEKLSHTGAWEWDLQRDLWTFSDEWLRIHGVSRPALTPVELLTIAHPDDLQRVEAAFAELHAGNKNYEIEHRIIRQDDGTVRTVKAQGQFVKDGGGNVVRVYGFVQDVTKMKRAEEQLLSHQRLLEAVVEHLPAAVLILRGSDLRAIMCNPYYVELASSREVVDKSISEIWPEFPELQTIFSRVLETGESYYAVDQGFMIRRSPGGALEDRYFTWSVFRVEYPGEEGFALLNTAWETTDRKRNELALRESENRLKAVIEHLAEGLIVIDPDGGALLWNQKALEMYQYTEQGDEIAFFESLIDLYELRTLDGKEIPVERWPVKRVMLREEFSDYELVVREKRKNWQRIYSFSGTLIPGLPGERPMGLVSTRDVTASKEAEEALKASEELLRNVLETLPVGVWIMDRTGQVTQANRAAVEIWGGAKFVGPKQFGEYKGWCLETGKRLSAEEWGGARAIAKGETSLNDEVEIEAFDGSRKIILNSSIPIWNDKGEISGAITVNQDITSRKRAEAALRDSEEKFRAVFEQAAVGMARVSFDDARWIDVNHAFSRMLGYSRQEMLAIAWPEMTHPEDIDLDLVPFRQMAAGRLGSYMVEKRFLHKEGHQVWARLSLSLVRNAHGDPDYEIAVIEDITSRKHAEEVVRQAKDQLEERVRERTQELEKAYADLKRETEERLAAVQDLRKNEQLLIQQSRLAALGEMLGNIAHQWRQPLNVLGLLIQQLAMDYEFGEVTQEHLDKEVAKAMQLILHMSQTINDFQNFLQQDKQKVSFNVNEVVATTISLLEATLKTMNVTVEIDQKEEITITGYRNEFAQVVMNIVTNSRDAFRERNIASPKVVITLFRESGRSVVTIADNAGGIPESIIEKIFDPYFTTKGPDRGTGIGLFMSKNIIEKSMNGALTVRNTGEGAEFRIEV